MKVKQALVAFGAVALLAGGILGANFKPSHSKGRPGGGGGTGGVPKMGRLRTIGFEAEGWAFGFDGPQYFEGDNVSVTNVRGVVTDTSIFRSGQKSLKVDSALTNDATWIVQALNASEQALARTYYARVYVRFTHYPNATILWFRMANAGGFNACVAITSAGVISHRYQGQAGGTTMITDSIMTLELDRWYMFELSVLFNSGTTDDSTTLRIDGVEVSSASGLNISPVAFRDILLGWVTTNPGNPKVMHLDDIALNDSQGSDQNSWPGPGQIVYLKPISDNQRGSWTGGAGGTTNLYDAVNNTPPIGVAAETDLTQIESADSSGNNSTDEYRANMTSYADAGIGDDDTIVLAQAVIDHGQEVATGAKTGSFLILSNPAQPAENTFTFGNDVDAAGTWPVFWRATWATAQYNPSVVIATSPVMRVRKTDSTTRVAFVDSMGIYVEYKDNSPIMQPMAGLLSPIFLENP